MYSNETDICIENLKKDPTKYIIHFIEKQKDQLYVLYMDLERGHDSIDLYMYSNGNYRLFKIYYMNILRDTPKILRNNFENELIEMFSYYN